MIGSEPHHSPSLPSTRLSIHSPAGVCPATDMVTSDIGPLENLNNALRMIEHAMQQPPKPDPLTRPRIWQADEHGEMEVIGRGLHLDGYVDVEDYRALLSRVEELEAERTRSL